MNGFVLLRVLLGALFFVSGFEKLTGPYQNFLFVIQNYHVLPARAEMPAALIFPWFELFGGAMLFLGIAIRPAIRILWALNSILIFVTGSALIRRLPIDECGCFGDLISLPLPVVFAMDLALWMLFALLRQKSDAASAFSLDRRLAPKG